MNDEIKEIIKLTHPGAILDYVDTKEHLLDLFNYITNLQQEKEDYKSRCEKASEFIKEKARNNCWIDQYEASDLINILQNGSDKE